MAGGQYLFEHNFTSSSTLTHFFMHILHMHTSSCMLMRYKEECTRNGPSGPQYIHTLSSKVIRNNGHTTVGES